MSKPYMQKDTGQVLLEHESCHEALHTLHEMHHLAGRDRFTCA